MVFVKAIEGISECQDPQDERAQSAQEDRRGKYDQLKLKTIWNDYSDNYSFSFELYSSKLNQECQEVQVSFHKIWYRNNPTVTYRNQPMLMQLMRTLRVL